MKKNIFREYDIRGIIGKDFIIEDVELLARAIITFFLKHNPAMKDIVIGMDGRVHSPLIKEKIVKVVRTYNIDVIDIGVCPTPLFYFALHHFSTTSGLMITASHNPSHYNGIKLSLEKKSLWGQDIQDIYTIMHTQNFAPLSSSYGFHTTISLTSVYVAYLKAAFPHLIDSSIKTIIDCGNGMAGVVMPLLIKSMRWKNTTLLYEAVDGTFPHHEADPTNAEAMKSLCAKVRKGQSVIGIGFDGDCDRMAAVSENGKLVAGDRLIALFGKKVLRSSPGATIICDVKTSQAVGEYLQKQSAIFLLSPCGHSRIKASMQQHKALLGGELSCHFFFADRYFGYDDGFYALMRLFEILKEEEKLLTQLLAAVPSKVSSAELRIDCEGLNTDRIVTNVKDYFAAQLTAHLITIDGMRASTKDGWGLIRPSNTQPMISLRFEAENKAALKRIKQEFFTILCDYFDAALLKKKLEL